MKVGISNIAWETGDQEGVFELLRSLGVEGIEIAPTKIWPAWEGASPAAAKRVRSMLDSQGFVVPSMQAILFGKPELSVFGDAKAVNGLIDHIAHVAELASALGASKLVFGSPRNRDPGEMDPAAAWEQGLNVFRMLGKVCVDNNVQLCVEANPEIYGCRFITNFRTAASFVRELDSDGVALHFDTGCAHMAGDTLEIIQSDFLDVSHVHASEPHLGAFDSPVIEHSEVARRLAAAGYGDWVVIEMRSQEGSVLPAIRKAVEVVSGAYGRI